jgi:hypothetical protein
VDFEVRQVPVDAVDELDSLYFWLIAEPDLRGRVTLRPTPPGSGKTGFVTESLQIGLLPDNATGLLVTALVSWIANRRPLNSGPATPGPADSGPAADEPSAEPEPITLMVTRSDGASLELSTALVNGLDPIQLRAQADDLAKLLLEDSRLG